MLLEQLQQEKKEQILAIAAKHGASNIRIFGSVARGEETNNSDIDLLIDLPKQVSLLKQISLQQSLEELLGRKVDLVELDTLHELIRDRVLREAVVL